jgi:hypothetical protein
VIEESSSLKESNDSEIESEKLLESSTEKDNKDKEADLAVVVRRRPKKTPPASTASLPSGEV